MSHIQKMHHAAHIHIWKKNHVTRKQIVLHISGKESCYTYAWVVFPLRMSHISPIDESCHTYEWATSHVWYFASKWGIKKGVTSHWMSHVSLMKRSCRTYNESCHIFDTLRSRGASRKAWNSGHRNVEGWYFRIASYKKIKMQRPNDESVASHVLDLCERALIFPKKRHL